MAENTDNLTLKLLQEMRGDMKDMKTEIKEVRTELHTINTKIDGNTIMLNILGGLIHQHDNRIEIIESKLLKTKDK